MWDPHLCGAIEQPDASLSLRISRGNGNVADETVTVRNTGGSTVDLTGWMLRDAGNAGLRYMRPAHGKPLFHMHRLPVYKI